MQTRFTRTDETTIVVERDFAAPVEELWWARTVPGVVRTWLLGPDPEAEFTICEMEMRSGGSYRWVWQRAGGEIECSGDVLEADPPIRLITVDRMPGAEPTTAVTTFSAADGTHPDNARTTMRTVIDHVTPEAADRAIAEGLAASIDANYERLAERWR